MKTLAASGVKRLAVVTPGFSVDCLETIEEIGRENAGYFYAAGGEEFARIACLNDSDGGIRVIEAIVLRELQGRRQAGQRPRELPPPLPPPQTLPRP